MPKLYNSAASSYCPQVTPNQPVMVSARPINVNVSCKLHPYSFQRTRLPTKWLCGVTMTFFIRIQFWFYVSFYQVGKGDMASMDENSEYMYVNILRGGFICQRSTFWFLHKTFARVFKYVTYLLKIISFLYFLKMKRKNEKVLSILLLLEEFCFITARRNQRSKFILKT